MKVRCNIDFDRLKSDIIQQVDDDLSAIGEEAVRYAKENGNYHDVTGHLRNSNYFKVEGGRLVIGNSADYASKVESEGKDVILGAYLYAETLIQKLTGK